MKTLAIDTSTDTLGVALVDEDKVIGEIITNVKKNHSVRAMPAVETLLKDCGMKPKDLERIVVAKGPGSYTGVRIGVTIAKTLSWSLNIPLVGVSSLEVLAANGRFFDGYISPLFDARRQQVYTGLYKYEDKLVEARADVNILNEAWATQLKELDQKVLFIGNDVPLHREVLTHILGEKAYFSEIVTHNPRPSELALIGMNKQPEEAHSLVPNYIRLAEAEANWLASQNKMSER
ncbi:tRNA (adenosine(37)-N6)-threonylcarbamoyltransferase complex dimerization subunit type 1 TsaB [Priestia filamentosa]|uniref:tRNA (adenosine(37)-N6)-threonylcarbamoyltransferase complex dimerization subunit type 1 TsaB n=1 Tax=Priestia filamentosa TaxID=1402861 RepID=UPI001FB2DBC3|nr:tRNA (adenosine(37)-N6)-threonylcarbamoyltransferase complex dimerization subunit type 1 TsaB [Priestia filamentosa]MED3727275.1 tRNA (adenosine(37)-N6)-threonylcarbamoyltransferase complex dimerization subunit type 1 TsaB [Priestia filamentosa]UOE60359.1 tRNA (adenosine(37)-N6)-threonylcarbamoyltransferase complex dimerization subunit type 1 TsaB [Priestia filamentosa]